MSTTQISDEDRGFILEHVAAYYEDLGRGKDVSTQLDMLRCYAVNRPEYVHYYPPTLRRRLGLAC